MKIVNIDPYKLVPYANNPRKNDDAVPYVKESIERFGFKVPMVIDTNNVVVCGHTRLKAALELGLKEVPCVIADDLTDEEIKAFRLADNMVSEQADWDYDLLDFEMDEIIGIDMEDFGFEFKSDEEIEHEHIESKAEVVDRVCNLHNLGIATYQGVGKYDIPLLDPVYELPEITEWIGFNYVMSDKNPEGKGVHFFVDDYQFERVWNEPGKYIEKLKQYSAVLTPDFSPFADMPMVVQLYNHYRKHWCGRLWQDNGITVIPTVRASMDERSLEWYLDGEPKDGIVAISAVWTNTKKGKEYFLEKEYKTMIETLTPKKILVYGGNKESLNLDGDIEYIDTFARKRFGDG